MGNERTPGRQDCHRWSAPGSEENCNYPSGCCWLALRRHLKAFYLFLSAATAAVGVIVIFWRSGGVAGFEMFVKYSWTVIVADLKAVWKMSSAQIRVLPVVMCTLAKISQNCIFFWKIERFLCRIVYWKLAEMLRCENVLYTFISIVPYAVMLCRINWIHSQKLFPNVENLFLNRFTPVHVQPQVHILSQRSPYIIDFLRVVFCSVIYAFYLICAITAC